MKILFLYPEYTYPRKAPPIGVASLAAYVLRAGHEAEIIDLNVAKYREEEFLNVLREYSPDIIGVSFMTNQYVNAVELIKLCKGIMPAIPVVAGGPHASALPDDLLEEVPELDFVVYGEGEIPLKKLIDCIEKNDSNDVSGVPNICFRNQGNGEIVKNPPTTELIDFNTPPWPAWHLVDLGKYNIFHGGGDSSKLTFALLSSRGCPGKCTFCDSHTIFGRKFRGRTAEDIFNEVIYLHKTYGMEQFDFVDDLITADRKRMFDLCEMLINSGIEFKWMANARLNTLTEEMLTKMQESGCVRIDVGVESGDPKVRKLTKKGIKNEQIVRIHKFCNEIGLYIGTFLMVGNLGETMESVKMTAKLMKGLTKDPSIAIACPYPGTELFKIAEEKGYLLTKDWGKYGTAPTFLKGYHPIMRTDTMSPDEILEAYHYLQSFFAIDKFRARYGDHFYFNPLFLKEYLLESKQYGGFKRKLWLGLILVYNLIKNKILIGSL